MSTPPTTTATDATIIPITTSSSDSPATPADIPRRSCTSCRRRMSTLDNHTICTACRETNCDRENRCSECRNWSDEQIDEYVKNRKSLDSKAKKKTESKGKSSSKSSADPSHKDIDTGLKDIEVRLHDNLQSNIKTMFADLTKQLLDTMKSSQVNPSSLSAPSLVPEEGSKVESAGGWVGQVEAKKSLGAASLPPGEVLESPPRKPPTPDPNNHVCFIRCHKLGCQLDPANRDKVIDWSVISKESGTGQRHGPQIGLINNNPIMSHTHVSSAITPATFAPDSMLFSDPSSNTPSLFLPQTSATPSDSLSLNSSIPPPFSMRTPLASQGSLTLTQSATLSSSSFSAVSLTAQPSSSRSPTLPPASNHPPPHSLPPVSSTQLTPSSAFSGANALPSYLHLSNSSGTFSYANDFSATSKVSSAPIVSSSSLSSASPFSLAHHNANVLGLSNEYRVLFRLANKAKWVPSRDFIINNYPHLIVDFDKDHQGGDSVYLSSINSDPASSISPSRPDISGPSSSFPPPLPPRSPMVPPISAFKISPAVSTSSSILSSIPSAPDQGLAGWGVAQSSYTSTSQTGINTLTPEQQNQNYDQSFSSQLTRLQNISGKLLDSAVQPSVPVPNFQPYNLTSTQLSHSLSGSSSMVYGSSAIRSDCQLGSQASDRFSHQTPDSRPLIDPRSGPQAHQASHSQAGPSSSHHPSSSASQHTHSYPVFPVVHSSSPRSAVPFRPFDTHDSDDDEPTRPQDPNKTFDTDPDSLPQVPQSADYRRMVNYVHGLFPQSVGEPIAFTQSQSEFETIFPGAKDAQQDIPTFTLFKRVGQALQEADDRLKRHAAGYRRDKYLLPRRKPFYGVSGNPSSGMAVPPNNSLESHVTKHLPTFRSVSLTVEECTSLETTFRAQAEALSHSLWVLTGLLSLIKNEGFVPKDQALFRQFISSLSMGLAHQANMSAAGISFTTLKRRALYSSHFLPSYPEALKKSALGAPACFSSSLFLEEDLSKLAAISNESSSIRTNQAFLEYVSGRHSRSPQRSPRQQSYYRQRRRSPSSPKTPKRVRFSGTPTPPTPPKSSSSSSPSRKNFGK